MSGLAETLERFRAAIAGPPQEVPLARSALLIASAEYPALDVDGCERRLDELAARLAGTLQPAGEPAAGVDAANDLLFSQLGFHGDEQDYDDPGNLYLNDVLDRRAGIPVTLAIIYIEVCQRAGLDMRAVGLPGHVVVRLEPPAGDEPYIDVFRAGRRLSADQCRRLVRAAYGRRVRLRDSFLSAVTPRQLIQRLLHNMKARALQSGDEERAARAIEFLLTMHPWDLDELRDRGMLRERLGAYAAALADLEPYVRHRPDARDFQTVSEAVRSLRRHVGADPA